MDLAPCAAAGALFSMLHQACTSPRQYNANHPDFPMQGEQLERYIRSGPRRRTLGTAAAGLAVAAYVSP